MQCDIAVIGAGIAGASVAAELAAHAEVVLIERETQPGYHTTGRSAAVYLKSYGNRVIKALTTASESFFHDPPSGFSDVPLLGPRTALFMGREGQEDRLDEELGAISPFVPTARLVGAEELLEIVPSLRPGNFVAAILDPDAEDMDVDAIFQGYLRAFRRAGGKLLVDCEPTRIERVGQRWRLETREHVLEAELLIDAAGAWADEVAALAGLGPLGLVPKRRTAFIVDGPQGVDVSHWPVVGDIDDSFYFRPESGGLLCSPADETPSPPCDAQPEELDIAIAADRIMQALDIEIRKIRRSWAGLRTFAPDKTPIMGFDPRAEGFFWLAGQGGYGIQTVPAMARTAAELVLGRHHDLVTAEIVEAMQPARLTA